MITLYVCLSHKCVRFLLSSISHFLSHSRMLPLLLERKTAEMLQHTHKYIWFEMRRFFLFSKRNSIGVPCYFFSSSVFISRIWACRRPFCYKRSRKKKHNKMVLSNITDLKIKYLSEVSMSEIKWRNWKKGSRKCVQEKRKSLFLLLLSSKEQQKSKYSTKFMKYVHLKFSKASHIPSII